MKRIFKMGLLLMAMGFMYSCGRDYETTNAAFKDTLTVNGVPNKELSDKDPANLVDTKSSAATEDNSDTAKSGNQGKQSDSTNKK